MAEQGEEYQDSSDQPPPPTPSTPRPPAYTGPFLFVNKNATNLRSRQSDEVFAVRSHAMQIARRSRKQSTPGSSEPRKKATENLDDSQSEAVQERTSVHLESSTGQKRSGQREMPRPPSANQVPGYKHRPAVSRTSRRPSELSLPSSAATQTAPTSFLPAQHLGFIMQHVMGATPGVPAPGAGFSDPFSAAALPITSFFNSLLQFWRVEHLSNFWPASIYLSPSHPVPNLVDDWIRETVISNPAMLHGMFAGTLSFVSNFVPAGAATPVLWARGMHHHGKCLEFTRSRLTMPGVSNEEALGMIHQSTTFSFHCGDFDASTVHRIASARLLNTLERGLDSVHSVLKALLIHCDALLAMHVPKRPSLDVESWAPSSWHADDSLRPLDDLFSFDPSDYAQSDQSHFLFDHPMYGIDGEDLTIQVQSMVNLQREALHASDLASTLSASGAAPSADPIYTWLALRHYALVCRSASLYMDILDSEPPEPQAVPLSLHLQRAFHGCVVLGTSYTFQYIMRHNRDNSNTNYIPFHHLRTRLTLLMTLMGEARRMQTNSISVPTQTLLFLFFAGAVAEEVSGHAPHPSSQPSHHGDTAPTGTATNLLHVRWFSVHFAMILQRMGLNSWEAARAILEKYVYDEMAMDLYLHILVSKRSEFMAVLGGGSGGVGGSAPPAGATSGPSTASQGQRSAPIRSSSSHSQVSPVPTPGYQQVAPPRLASALSPIAGQDFAAGFWEHMGLGLDSSMEFESMGDDDVGVDEEVDFTLP